VEIIRRTEKQPNEVEDNGNRTCRAVTKQSIVRCKQSEGAVSVYFNKPELADSYLIDQQLKTPELNRLILRRQVIQLNNGGCP
jgi:hypothetical protein